MGVIAYRVLAVPLGDSATQLEEKLNFVGGLGWDLVGVTSLARGPMLIFRRLAASREEAADAHAQDMTDLIEHIEAEGTKV